MVCRLIGVVVSAMTRKRDTMHLMDAMLLADVEITNVSRWCRDNGVDRRTYYRHRARIEAEGQWQPRSRRPHHSPNATPAELVTLIGQLRDQLAPDNGADRIRDRLVELSGQQDWAVREWSVPARATINRILSQQGKLASSPRKRPKSSYRRFSYARPRDCYQIDGTEIPLAGGGKAVVIEVLDDCTRTLVATHTALRETSDAAITAFEQAVAEYGAPGLVLADNGAAFTARYRHTNPTPSRFERAVTSQGSQLIHASPYHPQTCGKVERHHDTFPRWLAQQPAPSTLDDLQDLAKTYRAHDNTERRHSALNRATPTQAWHAAAALGGPSNLPRQTNATVHRLTVDHNGTIRLNRHLRIFIGRGYARTTITLIRNGDHITAYTPTGTPLGHLHLDTTRNWQGSLTPTG